MSSAIALTAAKPIAVAGRDWPRRRTVLDMGSISIEGEDTENIRERIDI
jgi:hypothetical protein